MEGNYSQMKKYKIEVDESQLELISRCLDFYSRVGALQLEELLKHPSVEKIMEENNKLELKEGSITNKGKVIDIGSDSIVVMTSDDIIEEYTSDQLSVINYVKLHSQQNSLLNQLNKIKSLITNHQIIDGYYGIYSDEIDHTCIISYDLHQQFRHQIWLDDLNKKENSIDSRVYLCDNKNIIKINKIDE